MVAFLFFLAGDNSIHYSDIVWSNDLSVCFSFTFFRSLIRNFSFSFCFPPIFDWEFSFFFCFPLIFDRGFSLLLLLFKAPSQLNSKWNFFWGTPSVHSVELQGKNSYPGSRFMAEGLRFWLKLACGRPNVTYVRVFAWQTVQGQRECPTFISMTRI